MNDLIEKLSSMDSELKDIIQKENPIKVENEIRNGILEYVNTVIKTSNNRQLFRNKIGQELYTRINLPLEEGGLSNQELIVLYQIETNRESNEMKNLINLIKQQFINIKIHNESSSNNSEKEVSKLESKDVNTIRNVLQYISNQIENKDE